MNYEPTIDASGIEPSDVNLEELEDRANRVAEERARHDCDPIVVEFAGSPKSGKSTSIDIISHFFRRMHLKVRAPTEGASKRTPYHLRDNLVAFNCYTLNYATSELLDAYYNVERSDLVILDRGPFDSLGWLKLLHGQGTLEEEDLETLKAFALFPLWAKLISRLYLFSCEPQTSMDRENDSKLTRRQGRAMNPQMLAELRERYTELQDDLKEYPVTTIDTTSENVSPLGTAFMIAQDVLDLFEEQSSG